MNSFFKIRKLINYVYLTPELEKKYKQHRQQSFTLFFRYSLVFGAIVYGLLIAGDWLKGQNIFHDIIGIRVLMLLLFGLFYGSTYIKAVSKFSQYLGVIFILLLMLNITWAQALIEQGLEEGYGMLITPGTTSAIIVFSGAEVGYGSLLIPLFLLPIGFTALQTFLTSTVAIIIINLGMSHSDLPDAFIETINSVFLGICFFTTILAYLVTQQRRLSFKLEHDLRHAKEVAEDAVKVKGTLLATMSHEVRNFINGILSITARIECENMDRDQRENISTLKYSGEALLTMLNDVLDLSKIEAGKLKLENEIIDLSKLVCSLVELMRSRAEEKNVTVLAKIDETIPRYILSDPTRLRQVLLNLISNAIKFTDEGAVQVSVTGKLLSNKNVRLRFEVSDTGIGIAEDALSKVFNEYDQAEDSTTRKYGGTGLGLSICKEIVHLMDGEIGADSTLGQGSSFWFDISVGIATSHEDIPRERERDVQEIPAIDPMSILLVEDDKLIAAYMEDILGIQNHKTSVAYNGHEAVSMVKEEIYDLILLDYNMPDLNGVETAKLIRQLDACAHIPIVALTASTQEDIILSFKKAGIRDCLTKPVNKEELFKVISKYSFSASVAREDTNVDALNSLKEDFGDEYVLKMQNNFINGIDEKLMQLDQILDDGDADEIILLAHDIASMSGMIGLLKTCDLFKNIESRIRKGAIKKPRDLYEAARKTYLKEKEQLDS